MRKWRVLDLFCGAGGAAMGLHRAGFEVLGVDIQDQPRYPFQFRIADALHYPLEGFDLIWASPPCQAYSTATAPARIGGYRTKKYEDLVEATRDRLKTSGALYVIENVPPAPLIQPFRLCGQMFKLRLRRHRIFESNFQVLCPPHAPHKPGALQRREICSVHGRTGTENSGGPNRRVRVSKGTHAEWRAAMGIDWMDRYSLTQAIPPIYAEHIGRFAIEALSRRADNT